MPAQSARSADLITAAQQEWASLYIVSMFRNVVRVQREPEAGRGQEAVDGKPGSV